MLEWIIYREGDHTRPFATGTAHSHNSAMFQAREVVRDALWRVGLLPEDVIEVNIEGNVYHLGTAEEFMGKTALRKMGY